MRLPAATALEGINIYAKSLKPVTFRCVISISPFQAEWRQEAAKETQSKWIQP